MRCSPIPRSLARLANIGSEPFAGSPADFGKFIAAETEKWGKVVRFAEPQSGVIAQHLTHRLQHPI